MWYPVNYVILSLFTFCTSIVVAKISIAAESKSQGIVPMTASLTAAGTMGITIYAFNGF
jgi:hypothetical protein